MKFYRNNITTLQGTVQTNHIDIFSPEVVHLSVGTEWSMPVYGSVHTSLGFTKGCAQEYIGITYGE